MTVNSHSANMWADEHSEPCVYLHVNPRGSHGTKELLFRLWEVWRKKKHQLDEYAFHHGCNFMTTLMRSMESWAYHFVVSPKRSHIIHSGIVLTHIHLDGWMHLPMFQTEEAPCGVCFMFSKGLCPGITAWSCVMTTGSMPPYAAYKSEMNISMCVVTI